MKKYQHLIKILGPYVLSFPRSRVHPLRSTTHEEASCFIKRDDELGGTGNGSKFRKYQSLLPSIQKGPFTKAVLIGGAYSNHIAALVPLLIELGIKPVLFLRGEPSSKRVGNLLYTSIFVPASDIHWINRDQWDSVEEIAQGHMDKDTILIPEGAYMPEALPGALTLGLDILRNEEELGLTFDHIFIEAGTGLTAIALGLCFAYVGKVTPIHIISLADKKAVFERRMGQMEAWFSELVGAPIGPSHMIIYETNTAFGSTNKKVWEEIVSTARCEGVLLDPIYSANLWIEGKRIIKEKALTGNILLIHNGGTMAVQGYGEKLSPYLVGS